MPVRLIADDDMYWAGKGQQVGDNMSFEYYNTVSLTNRGAEVKWMETNHELHLLHHNKFLVFDMGGEQADAVWCGAGNLTGTGFTKNWENFYYVTIPEIVDAYKAQYDHMWNDLATASGDMPTENILPPTSH
jgi:phosphatidylserine/phosphatidylglycerophosphate/cardiolipin synthase-like enzyme